MEYKENFLQLKKNVAEEQVAARSILYQCEEKISKDKFHKGK